MNKKAEGINYMILFIASIIVAGIAASVLMQTSFDLQNQALESGKKAKSSVSNAIEVIDLYAEDGKQPQGTVRNFYMTIKLAPGSEGISLSQMHLEGGFQSGSAQTTAVDLNESERNCTIGTDHTDSGFWTDPATERGNFSYIYLKKGNLYRDGYVQRGDLVMICMRAPYEIDEDKPFALRMTTPNGEGKIIESLIPDVVNTKRVHLYP